MPLTSEELELLRAAAKDEAAFTQLTGMFEQLAEKNRVLEQNSQYLRRMAHHFPNGALYLLDRDLRYIVADGEQVQPGLTREMLEGYTLQDVFPPNVVELVQPFYNGALGGSPVIREMLVAGKFYKVQYVPVRDDNEEVFAVLAVVQDITELRKAQEALADSEARTRSVLSALAEGVMLQDRDGAIIYCNAAAERILGLSRDQMTGRTSLDPRWQTIHEDGTPFPGETHPAMVALTTGRPQKSVVMGVYKPDGALSWVSINSQPVFHPDEVKPYSVVVSFVDITARKQAESDSLELALERKRTELLGHFIQNASHEFRTPLSIIKTSLYLLNKTQEADQRVRKAAIISEQVNRIDRLVDMLVEQLIIDSGIPFQTVMVDLNSLARSCVDEVGAVARKNKLRVELDLAPDMPKITGDPERLIEALGHIVENAVGNTLEGGKITVRTNATEAFAVVEVEDNGIGIADEDLPRVFERFYRRDHAHTTPGFGLGLSIADKIVERHNGQIEVESAVGVGSTFRVILPR